MLLAMVKSLGSRGALSAECDEIVLLTLTACNSKQEEEGVSWSAVDGVFLKKEEAGTEKKKNEC